MEPISKVGKNKQTRTGKKYSNSNFCGFLLNFQIFESSGYFSGQTCCDWERSRVEIKIFSEIFSQEPPRPRTSSSWRPTRPPGSSSSGTLQPSPTRRIRSSTGQFSELSWGSSERDSICLIPFELDLQIVWLTEVNQICEKIKSRQTTVGDFIFTSNLVELYFSSKVGILLHWTAASITSPGRLSLKLLNMDKRSSMDNYPE